MLVDCLLICHTGFVKSPFLNLRSSLPLFICLVLIGTKAEAAESDLSVLAQRYAPIVVHDSQEPAPLTSIDAQLQVGAQLTAQCPTNSTPLRVNSPDFWQEASTQALAQNCQQLVLDFGHKIAPPQSVLYYHVIESGLYLTLQYWMFYSWNSTAHMQNPLVTQCGSHEGDWEHIAIRLDRQALASARSENEYQDAINDLYFAQHNRPQHREKKYFRPNYPALQFEGNHIKVFPAQGTHASLPWPGTWPLMTLLGQTFSDRNDGKGLRVDSPTLLPITQMPWFGYPGKWGADQHDICDTLEQHSSTSNDGAHGPGHGNKSRTHNEGDWYDILRPFNFKARHGRVG